MGGGIVTYKHKVGAVLVEMRFPSLYNWRDFGYVWNPLLIFSVDFVVVSIPVNASPDNVRLFSVLPE